MDISRRKVLQGAAVALTAVPAIAEGTVQTRTLGRTGARVPIIAMGCGESWWKALNDEDKCLEALNLAFQLGITYFDTGQTYGRGISESWVGKGIRSHRKDVFVTTKITIRNGDDARRETDRSLERLQTSWIDIVHIHNLADDADLVTIEKPGGVLDVVHKLRDQKIARFIGITSHTHPTTLKTAIERHDFDCVQMALNAAQQGYFDATSSRPGNSFESVALPAAVKKQMGIIAMKVTGRTALIGDSAEKAKASELIRYTLSLPISVAVIGMAEEAHIRENADLARSFQPMPQPQMKTLADRMAAWNKVALDRHFANHLDG